MKNGFRDERGFISVFIIRYVQDIALTWAGHCFDMGTKKENDNSYGLGLAVTSTSIATTSFSFP